MILMPSTEKRCFQMEASFSVDSQCLFPRLKLPVIFAITNCFSFSLPAIFTLFMNLSASFPLKYFHLPSFIIYKHHTVFHFPICKRRFFQAVSFIDIPHHRPPFFEQDLLLYSRKEGIYLFQLQKNAVQPWDSLPKPNCIIDY
ncbi:hypothetical protein GA0061094_2950 [[Bacillus] enclensis]|uniref:Uncharacterized protein n=1 Tax=[Bacillus] enclensis TaxID=1402860 RepID=A0A1C4CGF5_9BACI|nr:hypothetical protein GA0061094_2950 [[Bacillus] enclensis]